MGKREVLVRRREGATAKTRSGAALTASERDWFIATALAVRDRIVERWMVSTRTSYAQNRRRVYYLSLEFLIGRLLINSLTNLGLTEAMRTALASLDIDLDKLRAIEPDAALGNGGLGRLAACFMESMATLSIAAHGYGIRYDHGLFMQTIKDGWQHEYPETWLEFGNPWEFPRPEANYAIGFGGSVEVIHRPNGAVAHSWKPSETVEAVAYDVPIVGWRGAHVDTLRLWSARAANPLRLDAFNRGDYMGAYADQVSAEAISKVLYPSDITPAGEELRLRREYFFASASLQDLIRRHLKRRRITRLADKVAIQLNDTHPAIGIAELMRLLLGGTASIGSGMENQPATFSYTNHTLLPEALERWPAPIMERLLPRHMQIIYLINVLHLDGLRTSGHDDRAFCRRCRSSTSTMAGRSAWDTWPFTDRTRSTESRGFTRTCSRKPCSAPCTSSIPTASSTRPTVLPSGAGCLTQTQA